MSLIKDTNFILLGTQKSNLTGTILSSPPDSSSSAGPAFGGDVVDKTDELKNGYDMEKNSSRRGETIQPDMNPSLHGVSGGPPRSYKEEGMISFPLLELYVLLMIRKISIDSVEPSELIQRPKLETITSDEKRKEEERKENSIHSLRKAQLSCVYRIIFIFNLQYISYNLNVGSRISISTETSVCYFSGE